LRKEEKRGGRKDGKGRGPQRHFSSIAAMPFSFPLSEKKRKKRKEEREKKKHPFVEGVASATVSTFVFFPSFS